MPGPTRRSGPHPAAVSRTVFPASSFGSWPSRFVTLSTRQSPGPHRHAGQFLPPEQSRPSCLATRPISPHVLPSAQTDFTPPPLATRPSSPPSCHQPRLISPLMIVPPRERQFLSAAARLRHRGDQAGPEASEMCTRDGNQTPFHPVGDRFGMLAKSPHSWSTSDHHINHTNHSIGGPCARPAHRRV